MCVCVCSRRHEGVRAGGGDPGAGGKTFPVSTTIRGFGWAARSASVAATPFITEQVASSCDRRRVPKRMEGV
jgi:hypothetical protein